MYNQPTGRIVVNLLFQYIARTIEKILQHTYTLSSFHKTVLSGSVDFFFNVSYVKICYVFDKPNMMTMRRRYLQGGILEGHIYRLHQLFLS